MDNGSDQFLVVDDEADIQVVAEVIEVLAAGVWALLVAGRAGRAETDIAIETPSGVLEHLTQSIENTEE